MVLGSNVFSYKGYEIPVDLVNLTGGGTNTWEAIAKGHMAQYDRYASIAPNHHVIEIGCGVGRDAMELENKLSADGKYLGIDIIYPSIEWCQKNITPKFPNFSFVYFDVYSQIHNPNGTLKTTDISIPSRTASIDRIILQSVFTHMFEDDIVHYLKEFARVLKTDGRVVASFFVTDEEALEMARNAENPANNIHKPLKFEHIYGDSTMGCYINDETYPEGAVGFTREAIQRMLDASGMALDGPIHGGAWCGRTDTYDGQDMLVLKKA